MSGKHLNVPSAAAGGSCTVKGGGARRVIPLPVEDEEEAPTCCYVPRIKALVLGLVILVILGAIGLALHVVSFTKLKEG